MLRLILATLLVALAVGQSIHKPSVEWDSRIVGGVDATEGQLPFQVSLRSMLNSHFCGGSIINNRWILSAAHCTIGRSLANTRVVVGGLLLNAGGISHQTSAIVNHPDYNGTSIENDVSVVQTASVIVYTISVQPIALGSDLIGGGVAAQGSGWGRTASDQGLPNNLQVVQLSTLSNDDCRSRHTAGNSAFIFDSTICSFTRVGEGTCNGDSGGPLTANGHIIGVASWVILPCGSGWPDSWARVSSFRSWIEGAVLP